MKALTPTVLAGSSGGSGSLEGLADVATSGSYNDLIDAPALAAVATSGAYADISGTPTLATVATSGAYGDLSGTPTLATVATSGSYDDLSNQPVIDGIGSNTLNLYDSNTTEVATSTAYSSFKEFEPVWLDVPPATGRYLEIDNNGGALPLLVEFSGVIYDQGAPTRANVYSTGVIISKGIAKLGVPVTGSNYTLYLDYIAIGTNPYGGYFSYGNHTYAQVEASLDVSATTSNRLYFALGYNTTNSRHFIAAYNTHGINVTMAFDRIKVFYV